MSRAVPVASVRSVPWWIWALTAAILLAAPLIWLKPVLAVLLLIAVSGAIVTAAWPNLATPVVLFLLYINAPVVAMRFHGVPFAVAAAIPLLLAIPMAWFILVRRQAIVIDKAMPWIVIFLTVQYLSAIISRDRVVALTSTKETLIEGLCLYFLIINAVRTPEVLRQVTWALVLAGAFLGGLSGFQQLTGMYHNSYGGFAQLSVVGADFGTGEVATHGEVVQNRLAGPIGDTNRYAQIMLMLVPLGMFRYFGERSQWLRIIGAAGMVLAAVGVAVTFSRGAAVAFVILFGIVVFLRYVTLKQCAILALLGVGVLLAFPQYLARLSTLVTVGSALTEGDAAIAQTDGAVQGRYTELMAGLLMAAEHPIVGVGPGAYPQYYVEYARRVGGNVRDEPRQPHVLLIGQLAEVGVLGLAAYVVIVLTVAVELLRARRRCARVRPDLANLATTYLLAVIAYQTTALFLHLSYARYFWMMLALASAAAIIALRESAVGPASTFRESPVGVRG